MVGSSSREWWDRIIGEPDEQEAFAQMLYTAFGGFVDWDLLPEPSRSKEEYRAKAAELLSLLHSYRERRGIVPAPLEPTPAMLEAGYRAMLAAREGHDQRRKESEPLPAPKARGLDQSFT